MFSGNETKYDCRSVTDLDLQSLVDEALGAQQQREIMKLVMASPELLERFNELVDQKHLLREWWHAQPKY